jgi:hypothetical protein
MVVYMGGIGVLLLAHEWLSQLTTNILGVHIVAGVFWEIET